MIFRTMKITVKQLRSIIKEEVSRAMSQSRNIAFKPGSPDIYSEPKDFSEFMSRVDALGVSLEDFMGDRSGAYELMSGVYNRPFDTLTTAHVEMADAIAKGNLDKLEDLVAQAPEKIKRGDKWLHGQMKSLRSLD